MKYNDIIINDTLQAIAVPKCAMTELKAIAIHEKNNTWIPEKDINKKFSYYNSFNKAKKRLRFAVYRDPFDRLVSFYYNKIINPNTSMHYKNLYNLGKDNISFKDLIQAIKTNFSKRRFEIDQHLRKQKDYYDVNTVDVIVKIEDLNDFLTSYNVLLPENDYNKTLETKDDFEQYREEILELYKEDYELLNSSKVWINPNTKE